MTPKTGGTSPANDFDSGRCKLYHYKSVVKDNYLKKILAGYPWKSIRLRIDLDQISRLLPGFDILSL